METSALPSVAALNCNAYYGYDLEAILGDKNQELEGPRSVENHQAKKSQCRDRIIDVTIQV